MEVSVFLLFLQIIQNKDPVTQWELCENLLDSRRQQAVREGDILPLFIKATEKKLTVTRSEAEAVLSSCLFILWLRSDIRTRYVGKHMKAY